MSWSMVVLFCVAVCVSAVILYALGRLWFGDVRNRQLASLFTLGLIVCFWILANALCGIVAAPYYPFLYTLSMMLVCAVPYALLWFFLNLSGSKLVHSRWVHRLLLFFPLADLLALVTNPLHGLYFRAYVYPRSPTGPLFWVHSATSYLTVLLALIVLFRYIFKNARKNPAVILGGVGTLLPYTYNILYTLGVLGDRHNLTSLGFFATIMIFVWLSYKSRLLNVKTTAFSSIFSSMRDPVLIVATDGAVVDANAAWGALAHQLGVDAGQESIHGVVEQLLPASAAAGTSALLRAIAQPTISEMLTGELRLQTADGRAKTFSLDRRPLYSKRRLAGCVVTLSDISEYRSMISEIDKQNRRLVELKELAEQASAAKGAFLANMSHEMRTPMNAVIGMTAIAKNAESSEKKDECIVKIEEASKHLLGVINDVLDMSKIEANKLELVNGAFDFEQMLMHAVDFIRYNVHQKQQRFRLEADPAIPRILVGDEQRIVQVLTNLLFNAVKFTPAGGEITLRAEALGEDLLECRLRLEVEDTGIGIDEDQQKKLFSSFQQADAGISRRFGGTGLGLAISKRIVEMAGGRIGVRSTPGSGSLFWVELALPKSGEDVRYELRQTPLDELEVLVVDPEPGAESFFKKLAAAQGFACVAAPDGQAALRLLERPGTEYRVVFAAPRLPDMDGAALAEAAGGRAGVNGVVLLAESAERAGAKVRDSGAGPVHFVAKPLFARRVMDAINACLEPGWAAAGEEGSLRDGMFAGKRILMAEDIDINREIVLALLEPTGLAIDCAENGNEARDLFGSAPDAYDAILMDIHMPEKDGYAATREIRALAHDWAGRVPIIAMTANVFQEDIDRCLACGMTDHLGKPLDIEEVVKKLSRYLPQRAQEAAERRATAPPERGLAL